MPTRSSAKNSRAKPSITDFEFQVHRFGNLLTLVLPYPPSMNRYWRNFRGRVVLSKDGRGYKDVVRRVITERVGTRLGPFTGQVEANIAIFRPQKSGDLDNFLKCVFDSLQGVAYENDSQITKITAERFDDKEDPRVEVTILMRGER